MLNHERNLHNKIVIIKNQWKKSFLRASNAYQNRFFVTEQYFCVWITIGDYLMGLRSMAVKRLTWSDWFWGQILLKILYCFLVCLVIKKVYKEFRIKFDLKIDELKNSSIKRITWH